MPYPPCEGMCITKCPNRVARCGVVGLIMRAEEQYGETGELFWLVAGEKSGTKVSGEVWLKTLMNPLTDDVHIDLAPPGIDLTADNILKLLADGPEASAQYRTAGFIYTDGCLLDTAEKNSSTFS